MPEQGKPVVCGKCKMKLSLNLKKMFVSFFVGGFLILAIANIAAFFFGVGVNSPGFVKITYVLSILILIVFLYLKCRKIWVDVENPKN
jgi:hypothetical protein